MHGRSHSLKHEAMHLRDTAWTSLGGGQQRSCSWMARVRIWNDICYCCTSAFVFKCIDWARTGVDNANVAKWACGHHLFVDWTRCCWHRCTISPFLVWCESIDLHMRCHSLKIHVHVFIYLGNSCYGIQLWQVGDINTTVFHFFLTRACPYLDSLRGGGNAFG